MEELLVRSKQAPLKFHIRPDYLGDRDKMLSELRFVDQVIHHIDRVQELHLFLPPLVEENFFPKLSSPAPRLQDLRISTLFGSSQWELPSVLFDGDTPALRTLQLYNFPVAWYSFKLSSLTTLNLCHLPARFQQNTGELLATLRCMQDLIHLYLHNALASAADFLSSTAFHTFQKFNLPHLSCLSLGAPFSTAAALLSCANIPLKTEVGLKCRPENDSSLDDSALLCSLLAKRFNTSDHQSPSSAIRSLVFEIERGLALLTFSPLERDDCTFSISPTRDYSIPLQTGVQFDESTTSSRDRIISDFCCSIPLPNVESVYFVGPPFSSTFWRKILGHLPNLRYLKVHLGYMPDLASVLSLTPRGETEEGGYADRGPDQVLAPVLEELELGGIAVSASLPEGLMMDPPAADVQSLYDALASRQESQGRLSVVGCRVYKHGRIDTILDMVGRWEDGHFHVVEESSEPYYHSDSYSYMEGSDSDPGSLEDG